MLNENIKVIRKSKGLSQEELAVKLNVVRQTVSKWEKGLSVPDSEMLLTISENLEVPVSTLLGETIAEIDDNEIKVISEKLEVINLQLAQKAVMKRKMLHLIFILFALTVVMIFITIGIFDSIDLRWDYNAPEMSVFKVLFHAFSWVFVRISPILFLGAIIGIVFTRKRS